MLVCPFCDKTVASFKSNSHIIPKSFLKPAKKNNHFAYLGILDGEILKKQDGEKHDFICSDCETIFSDDDSYGSVVLLNSNPKSSWRKNITERRIPFQRMEFYELNGFDYSRLKKFVLSIILRDHCHRVLQNKTPLMDDSIYKAMRAEYHSPTKNKTNFIVTINKLENIFSNLMNTISMPVLNASSDGISFTCGGYAFMVYFTTPKDTALTPFIAICALDSSGKITMPISDFISLGVF